MPVDELAILLLQARFHVDVTDATGSSGGYWTGSPFGKDVKASLFLATGGLHLAETCRVGTVDFAKEIGPTEHGLLLVPFDRLGFTTETQQATCLVALDWCSKFPSKTGPPIPFACNGTRCEGIRKRIGLYGLVVVSIS